MRCAILHAFADGLQTLQTASDFDTLHARLQTLCGLLRHRYFRYQGQFTLPRGDTAQPEVSNYPEAWLRRYDERGYAALDPVLAKASTQLTPVEWTADLFNTPDTARLRSEQAAAGLRAGVTYPVFAPSGAPGILSLAAPDARPRPRLRAWTQHLGATLAMHVHDTAWRIVQRDASRVSPPALTPRERECLQWVARGKTSWEIGRILTISEHGVVFHLRSVMRKFDVSSRHRAAKLASDYGLLDEDCRIALTQSAATS